MSDESSQEYSETVTDSDVEQVTTDDSVPETGDAEHDYEARIAELETQLADAKEQALRAVAEAQNARRRAEQDVEKAHKFSLEKIVKGLLPVVDNLERAIDAAAAEGADPNDLNEGVQLTLKTFLDALSSHKVDEVAGEGEPFNPEVHQAISAIENPESEPNTVLSVVQKGYTLHGRLMRPAMVVVSKASA